MFSKLPSCNSSLGVVDVAKKKSYNIDSIVNDHKSIPEVQQNLVPVSSNQTQHSIQNQNFEDGTPKEGGVYRYQEVCADVKHARTPLNTVNQETHSPQLPVPSPNYPVQAEAQLPNTIVPTINNNYITTPHATSQCDLKENTCCQTHSNESDLKQTDHLSNLDLTQNNLNKVNLPETNTNTKSNQEQPQLCNNNENSTFTVLNIPNLSFQTPSKKPKLSKIDLATLKRKLRRKKRLKLDRSNKTTDTSSSSYCSSSESECENNLRDLWIKTGPPSKPDLKPEKLEFLKLFRLTTHMEKNCKSIELR